MTEILACPSCRGKLTLEVEEVEFGEVKKGKLNCGNCNRFYEIIDYIPRFVSTDLYVKSFSFEWRRFSRIQFGEPSVKTFIFKTGFDLQKLRNKLILDAGCGGGRFMDVVSRSGGKVVGFDLSYAVDAAFTNLGLRRNVHLVQADIFKLPFKEETFDFIYCIGVLHHTPDPKRAFKHLCHLLKKNGVISVWVYSKETKRARFEGINRLWRSITSRLPPRLLYYFSYVAIPLYYFKKLPKVGGLLDLVLLTSMNPNWEWRVLDTFDWYSPKYQSKHSYREVVNWFQEANLNEIRTLNVPVSVTAKK